MAQCYCSAVLMATPEEAEQDVSLHSTIEGGEVRSFRLAGPRLKIECIVNPALVQFAIGNSPKVIYRKSGNFRFMKFSLEKFSC